jgi:hypothetical protein
LQLLACTALPVDALLLMIKSRLRLVVLVFRLLMIVERLLLLCPEIPHSVSSLDSFDKPPRWSDQSTMIYPQPRHVATWLAVVASSALPMLADAQEMSDVTKCVPPPPTTQPNIRAPQRENSNRVH